MFWNRWCDYPDLVLLKPKKDCCCAQQVGTKPTPSSQVNPQWLGAHKEDVDAPRDCPQPATPCSFRVSVFNQLKKSLDGCLLDYDFLFPWSYLGVPRRVITE